jgi:hypothetical protein
MSSSGMSARCALPGLCVRASPDAMVQVMLPADGLCVVMYFSLRRAWYVTRAQLKTVKQRGEKPSALLNAPCSGTVEAHEQLVERQRYAGMLNRAHQ